MTTIQRAVQPSGVCRPRGRNQEISATDQRPTPFSRSDDKVRARRSVACVGALPRDRAMPEMLALCRDVEQRLGPKTLHIPFNGGTAMATRNGPNNIVCQAFPGIYFEIVNGEPTEREGQATTDENIVLALRAFTAAIG